MKTVKTTFRIPSCEICAEMLVDSEYVIRIEQQNGTTYICLHCAEEIAKTVRP